MANNMLNIAVIAGSTREGRFSETVAAWVAQKLKEQKGVTVEVLDLREYQMPFFNESATPGSKKEPYKNEAVARFTKKIAKADAFVIVTPEYNHSTSGVLKNALDWVYQEWNNKAVGFVGYGSVGGARAVEHLRLVSIELQMAPIRESVHFNGEQFWPVRFGKVDASELFDSHTNKVESMITQLLWWGRALKSARG